MRERNSYEKQILVKRAEIEDKFKRLILDKKNRELEDAHNNLVLLKKSDELKVNEMIGKKAERLDYKGLKVPSRNALLWGYDLELKPFWGTSTNYIVGGKTGNGKSKKMQAMLLNYLANRQGIVYICDLKKIDYKYFNGCQNVAMYIDELDDVKQVVEAFKFEYERRIRILTEGYIDHNGIRREYADFDDYNARNDSQLPEVMMLVDEYADIADVCQDRNKRPIGVYQDIIKMARTCRAVGGRIILGTQRPSVDVIIGTLKANCEIIGMKCLNGLNSKIMIDVEGCQELAKGEALAYNDNDLTKIFSYYLTPQQILEATDKLKAIHA